MAAHSAPASSTLHPPSHTQAVRAGKMPELRLSIYEDAERRDPILEDVLVPVPAEPQRKYRCTRV